MIFDLLGPYVWSEMDLPAMYLGFYYVRQVMIELKCITYCIVATYQMESMNVLYLINEELLLTNSTHNSKMHTENLHIFP